MKNIGDSISWKQGPAEATNLPDESAHWISKLQVFIGLILMYNKRIS